LRGIYHRQCFIYHENQKKSRYSLIFSSFIALKYHCFPTQSSETLIHLTRIGRSFQIQSGSWICSYSQTAISTFSLLWNRRPNSCCFSSQNNITCREVWYFSMTISPQKAIFVRKWCCSRLKQQPSARLCRQPNKTYLSICLPVCS
jgi:hypothetical protein